MARVFSFATRELGEVKKEFEVTDESGARQIRVVLKDGSVATSEMIYRGLMLPLLVRHRSRRMSPEAIGAFIHPPLQVAIPDHQHPNQRELQDLYHQPYQE